jgi:hypothetical protein
MLDTVGQLGISASLRNMALWPAAPPDRLKLVVMRPEYAGNVVEAITNVSRWRLISACK